MFHKVTKPTKKIITDTRSLTKKGVAGLGVIRSRTTTAAHMHVAERVGWYHRWHNYRHHKKIHVGVLAVYLIAIAISLSIFQSAKAGDLNDNWDFSTGTGYTLSDSSLVEVSNGTVRLKALNYTSDANTMGLWHFDENTGSTVADDSSSDTLTAVGSPSWAVGNLVNALTLNGSTQYLTANDSSALSLTGQHTIESWVKFSSPFASGGNQNQAIVDKGSYRLYYNNDTGKITYELANNSASTWTQRAGNDVNRSWDLNGKQDVRASVTIGTDVYTGLGSNGGTGDAEVWKYDGSTWSQVGGDARNSSWPDGTYEAVRSLAVDGTTLFAGIGESNGDAEVWSCDTSTGCAAWTKRGGDTLNSSWANSTYETVSSMAVLGGNLYAGLGNNAGGDAEIWRCSAANCTSWTKVGGDALNLGGGASPDATYEEVYSMTTNGTLLFIGLGATAGDADVWSYNPTGNVWTKIGGDALNPGGGASWAASTFEYVLSMSVMGTDLYIGLGTTVLDAEVWRYNISSPGWTKVGGDGVNPGGGASWNTNYEAVYSLTNDGTNLYAGLGNSTGDSEVWRLNGTTWTKVGGDSVNPGGGASWATGSIAYTMTTVGSTVYVGQTNNSSGNGEVWRLNGTAWTRIGGAYVNKSWGYFGTENVTSMTQYNGKLYASLGNNSPGDAVIWEYDGSTWQVVGGQGISGSWTVNTIETVNTMIAYKGNLYVGLGFSAGDGDLWRYNGSTWTQVGGDAINLGGGASWVGAAYENVHSLAVFNDKLYAGLGASAQDAEVWQYDGATTWTKIGGDGVGSSWAAAGNIESVLSMVGYQGQLYAGLGSSAGDGDVWRYNPGSNTWLQIGGDGLNSGWAGGAIENVWALAVYDNQLVAGMGNTTGDADVWSYNGTIWAQLGGDGVNSGWGGASGFDRERIRSLVVYNGELYAAMGTDTGDGEVWKHDGTSWTRVGGSGLNDSWAINTVEEALTLATYKGKLYAGLGNSTNIDAAIYSWGNNAYVESSTTTQDTNWHHIAATYDGATVKLYRDGSEIASSSIGVSIPDSTRSLLVGNDYGSSNVGFTGGNLGATIDETRISNSVRSSFQTKPYTTSAVTVELTDAIRTAGVWTWDTFIATEAPAGGTIAYRLSDDGGTSWKYWDGSAWASSGSLTEVNSYSVIDTNIDSFPVTFSGIKWQAVLQGNGDQQVAIDDVALSSNSDSTDPSANASAIAMQRSNGGASVASNGWTNGATPFFSWNAAVDAESGVKGYCLSLSQTGSDNPITTKGILGTSPVTTGGNCQFVVSTTSIDLATSGYLGTPLASSGSAYYLNIRAIDNAGNISDTNEQFQFRFDNTNPTNPGFITAPSGFINTKSATLTWPTAGGTAAQDAHSQVAGLQYRVNGGNWYGDVHSGLQDASDLLANDGSYATTDPPDYSDITEGVNTFEFRTWDAAGNYSTSYVTAQLKVNTNGAPSEPQNVTAVPGSNTANAFAFTWNAPASYVGDASNITYCYTINVAPTVSNCSFTPAGVTSLGSGPYATQPGANTIYLVARDESSNINYSTYATAVFTANTTAPGIPLNMDIVDVSIKSTSNWRLALTWDPPAAVGSGVASYKVYRSTDNSNFSFVGASTSTTYIDAGLSQQDYYYRVRACDSTNNCGVDSSVATLQPTGKFTSPATITAEPVVDDITTRKAMISWATDRPSDSKIAIGTKSGEYGSSEIANSSQVTNHKIELTNMQAGTTYYYVAKWTDEDGNTGTSSEQSFTTLPAPTVKEVSAVRVGLASATIQFTTKQAVQAKVYFGQSEGFGGLKVVNTSATESSYSADLPDLSDGAKYFYKVNSLDAEGNEYEGSVLSFTTPQRPRIANVALQPVEGEPTSTQQVSWTTNVPTTSQVVYGKVGQGVAEISDSQFVTEHVVVLRNLEDDSEYSLVAQSRDGDGNLATSERQVFKTALDTRPPKISDIQIETTIRGVGSEARGQLVVTWKTDEPATSQVAFGEGASSTSFSSLTSEDAALVTEHIVIISDLSTAKVFNVQAVSKDRSGNQVKSEGQSTIVGRASDSVLSIIFNTLQQMFGFLGEN